MNKLNIWSLCEGDMFVTFEDSVNFFNGSNSAISQIICKEEIGEPLYIYI